MADLSRSEQLTNVPTGLAQVATASEDGLMSLRALTTNALALAYEASVLMTVNVPDQPAAMV